MFKLLLSVLSSFTILYCYVFGVGTAVDTTPSVVVYTNSVSEELQIYSPADLFGDSAIAITEATLAFIQEQDEPKDYKLVFGITPLPSFHIDNNLQAENLDSLLTIFDPQQIIEDSIQIVKNGYTQKLIDQYISDYPSFNSANTILIVHNLFVHPYNNDQSILYTSLGVHTQATVPQVLTDIQPCGELDPTQETEQNDRYLVSFVDLLVEDGNIYDSNGINDRLRKLNDTQKDSIGLMIDTISDERDWAVVVDIFEEGCRELTDLLVDTTAVEDTIQFIIEVTENGAALSFEAQMFVADNISQFLPMRYRDYIIDSVMTEELDRDSLHRALMNGVERLRRPLPGDMFFEMRIVHSGGSPTSGGMFGCARGGSGCSTSSIPNLHNYSGKQKVHNGLDIYAALNTDIFAMYDGTVQTMVSTVPANTEGNAGSFGNKVRLRHTPAQYGGATGDDDIYTYYTHLNAVENIAVGDAITQGQKLGETGRTGNAIDIAAWRYHSHINVYVGGTARADVVDPRPYLFTQFDLNGGTTN